MPATDASAIVIYRLLDLQIDPARQRVLRGDQEISLPELSMRLLVTLLEQGDRVVSVDELIEKVWLDKQVSDETVTQRVKLLRQALDDDSRSPRYIRSVRGRGYQLCVQPEQITTPLISSSDDQQQSGYTIDWRLLIGPLLPGLLAIAGLLWWWLQPSDSVAPTSAVTAVGSAQDHEQQLLQRGWHYLDMGQREDDERAIELFERVLTLAPDTAGARLGLSIALSRRVCWYNSSKSEVHRAQALAQSLVDAGVQLADAHAALGFSYDCQGLMERAIAHYRQSLQLNPDQARTRASMAHLLSIKGQLATALQQDLQARASGQPLRFVDLQIARNLHLMGFVAAAERLYRRTFELSPDNVFGNIDYPRFLMIRGRTEQAREHLRIALQRGVLRKDLYIVQAELALLENDKAAALEALTHAIAINPHQNLARMLHTIYADGDVDRQWAEAQIERIESWIMAGDHWPNNWLEMVLIHQALNDGEAALAALSAAVDAGFREKDYLLISPLYAAVREVDGFDDIIQRISLLTRLEREQALAADWLPPALLASDKDS
ncbi:MAG: hypothetical protein Tsb002_23450 [Wenzhouxiangellaceae bacterium]